MKKIDTTKYVRQAIDFLFIYNRVKTSMGVVLAIVLMFIVKIFKPFLSKFDAIIDANMLTANTSTIFYLFFGVFLTNFTELFKRKKLDPDIETALFYIRDAQANGKLTETEIRQMYRKLYETVLTRTAALPAQQPDDTAKA